MRTKKSFITDPEVYRVASELQSCIKICHKTYIGWTVLVNYLWKNEEVRSIIQRGHRYNMEEISKLAKNLLENFTTYFEIKLK